MLKACSSVRDSMQGYAAANLYLVCASREKACQAAVCSFAAACGWLWACRGVAAVHALHLLRCAFCCVGIARCWVPENFDRRPACKAKVKTYLKPHSPWTILAK